MCKAKNRTKLCQMCIELKFKKTNYKLETRKSDDCF